VHDVPRAVVMSRGEAYESATACGTRSRGGNFAQNEFIGFLSEKTRVIISVRLFSREQREFFGVFHDFLFSQLLLEARF
jgi:hypothetical protein